MTNRLEVEILSRLNANGEGLFDNELAQRVDPLGSQTPLDMSHALRNIVTCGFAHRSTQPVHGTETLRPFFEITELGQDTLFSLDATY